MPPAGANYGAPTVGFRIITDDLTDLTECSGRNNNFSVIVMLTQRYLSERYTVTIERNDAEVVIFNFKQLTCHHTVCFLSRY